MNNRKLKLEVVTPTTIKCGHIQWFALDTKLVGKTKALIEENERLNNIIQSINSVCSSMQFSAPENMYIHLQRMIEILDYWKKGEKNDTKTIIISK